MNKRGMITIRAISRDGVETTWLVDEARHLDDGDIALWRSGEHVITLGLDDYARGWEEFRAIPLCGCTFDEADRVTAHRLKGASGAA